MIPAVITFRQIVELIILFVVVNAVILAPLVVAVLGGFAERLQNQTHRPRV